MCVAKDKEKVEFLDKVSIDIFSKITFLQLQNGDKVENDTVKENAQQSMNCAELFWQERERRYGVNDGE